jgi:hypothetical protein
MAQEKVAVQPQITLGDKVVKVGPLDWAGLKNLVDAFSKADLPLPNLAGLSIHGWLDSMQAELDEAGEELAKIAQANQRGNLKLYEIILEFLSDNLPIVWEWLLKHPPLLTALVSGSSNVSPDELEQLSAGQLLRVARAAWQALVDDGFFTEAAGFFGDLLGLGTNVANQPPQSQPPQNRAAAATAASTSESTSVSAPLPAGA